MTNIACERPYAFYFLLLLIPALLISFLRHRKIVKKINSFTVVSQNDSYPKRMRRLPVVMFLRSFLRSLSWVSLVFAYAGISWGTYLEAVGKTGSSVAMVFDISYSMMAKDAQAGQTRLSASGEYASMLLSHIQGSLLSVVLAKGDGATVVPLTEDRAATESILASLSPGLMSVGGTSLGKGVRTALKNFPKKSSALSSIWIFTDGEETDGLLEGAIADALKSGVSVCIVGFGSLKGTKVLAGDGKTSIYTALRAENMKKVCSSALKKIRSGSYMPVEAAFVDSSESGSAIKVLNFLKGNRVDSSGKDDSSVTYEVRPVQRHSLFLFLSLIFVILSFVVSELDVHGENFSLPKKSAPKKASTLALLVLFCSCSARFEGGKKILEGSWKFHQRNLNGATADFLQTFQEATEVGDSVLAEYALYNLGSAYIMQNEKDAALEKFSSVSSDAPLRVKFSSLFNTGVIFYRNGDYENAVKCFRSALKIDGSSMNAKVNLELSMLKSEADSKILENSVGEASETEEFSRMQEAVFNIIRESDKKQWKNGENINNGSGANDF